MRLTENSMRCLLTRFIDRTVNFEEDMADDVLLDMGFDYETLYELGYKMQTYSIEDLFGGAFDRAIKDTLEADFGGKMECDGQPITREDLIEYNLMTDTRYTINGRFVNYGEYIRDFENKYWKQTRKEYKP